MNFLHLHVLHGIFSLSLQQVQVLSVFSILLETFVIIAGARLIPQQFKTS